MDFVLLINVFKLEFWLLFRVSFLHKYFHLTNLKNGRLVNEGGFQFYGALGLRSSKKYRLQKVFKGGNSEMPSSFFFIFSNYPKLSWLPQMPLERAIFIWWTHTLFLNHMCYWEIICLTYLLLLLSWVTIGCLGRKLNSGPFGEYRNPCFDNFDLSSKHFHPRIWDYGIALCLMTVEACNLHVSIKQPWKQKYTYYLAIIHLVKNFQFYLPSH